MKLGFIDFIDWDYQIDTVYRRPMGGSQSAVCYLAEQLAQLGIEVFLINYTRTPCVSRGVTCLPVNGDDLPQWLSRLDALVVVSNPGLGMRVAPLLRPDAPLLLWTQDAPDQDKVEALHNPVVRDALDGFALVSEWQREGYVRTFGIDRDRVSVTRNAISPRFADLFPPNTPVLAAKTQPPTLVYTSTPFRGLDLLLEAFPRIRDRVPDARLKVFSSMKVYQMDDDRDAASYGELYRRCQTTAGVEYVGSVPQPELAEHLRTATLLAYPNTFPETSCIAVMEALASGCRVVTTELGALPETSAGFARLVAVPSREGERRDYALLPEPKRAPNRERYLNEFVEAVVATLQEPPSEERLRSQVDWMQTHGVWEKRARHWQAWLTATVAAKRQAVAQVEDDPRWQAQQAIARNSFDRAIALYEAALQANPDDVQAALAQGMAYLLAGQPEAAQEIWMMVLMAGVDEGELRSLLQSELQRRRAIAQNLGVMSLYETLAELEAENPQFWLDYAIYLAQQEQIDPALRTAVFDRAIAAFADVAGSDEAEVGDRRRSDLLQALWTQNLNDPAVWGLLTACVRSASPEGDVRPQFLAQAGAVLNQGTLAANIQVKFAEFALELQPDNLAILVALIDRYQQVRRYEDSTRLAREFCDRAPTLPQRLAAQYLLLRGLMKSGGQFQQAIALHRELETLIDRLIDTNPEMSEADIVQGFALTSFLPYLEDNPEKLHGLRRRWSSFLQQKLRDRFGFVEPSFAATKAFKYKHKIGYLSSALRRNSVGHLVRWLLNYHDRDRFEIFAYSLRQTQDEIQQDIASSVSHFRDVSGQSVPDIARTIRNDNLDLLVDLDSLTCSQAVAVLALKPAPVQVTWLGFDASGLPAIDYVLASDRILPQTADRHYSSPIYRLPNSIIAVDGFEIGVPTLRREDLDIPADAVVYLSSQTGAKRHPDNARSQLEIIRQVPNSYFLIKGLYSDRQTVRAFFETLAAEVGVDPARLRLLPDVPQEAVHRANLNLADIVLDTYPYNGATTTLETLWMGVPLVTQVGEQFASRHSYDFLQQAGVSEGIAFNAAEYVDWGVRLGCDRALRDRVAWTLRQSRRTSPLWNAEAFTRQMEAAIVAILAEMRD